MPLTDRLLPFLTAFPAPPPLPVGVTAHNPYCAEPAQTLLSQFAQRFYADDHPRVAVLGINPGRLGGGTTGVAFTDYAALTAACGLPAPTLPQRRELSAQFVYQVVAGLGGAAAFYQQFYLGSVYPLVLLHEGLNYNYYDSPALLRTLWPQLKRALCQQADLGFRRDVVVSLGRRNAEFLTKLNRELGLFGEVIALDHPRYLMQYRRRDLPQHVAHYVRTLGALVGH